MKWYYEAAEQFFMISKLLVCTSDPPSASTRVEKRSQNMSHHCGCRKTFNRWQQQEMFYYLYFVFHRARMHDVLGIKALKQVFVWQIAHQLAGLLFVWMNSTHCSKEDTIQVLPSNHKSHSTLDAKFHCRNNGTLLCTFPLVQYFHWVWYPHETGKANKMCLNETYSRVRVGKHLSDMFHIKNDLKQGDASSPMLFNFALKNAIRNIQVNQDGLKLNDTHQLMILYWAEAYILQRKTQKLQ